MNIIIVGGGKIGTIILESLVKEGNDVVAIDRDPEVTSALANQYDVMCVCGNGVDWETLEEAGVEKAQLVIAATGSDESNMLCCTMAKKMGAKNTIARIRKPEYNDQSLGFIKQALDISMVINSDAAAAKELYHLLRLPGAESVETFSRKNFDMVEVVLREDSPLDKMNLMQMRKRYPASYLVGVVQRGEEIFIPGGSFVLQSGDRVGITASWSELEKLMKMVGSMQGRAKSVMIVGACRTAYYLSKRLLGSGCAVTIVEKDKDICHAFAEELPEAVIVHGDGSEIELLMEEGLGAADAFVSLTGSDQENILLSYQVKSHANCKVITKIHREEYLPMAQRLGLDCTVSPRRLMSDVLAQYARALNNSMGSKVETLYHLMNGKVETVEFKVQSDFEFTNTPLKEMKLKPNTLIAGILRGRKIIIPTGNDVILPEDRVVVLSAGSGMTDLRDIMG